MPVAARNTVLRFPNTRKSMTLVRLPKFDAAHVIGACTNSSVRLTQQAEDQCEALIHRHWVGDRCPVFDVFGVFGNANGAGGVFRACDALGAGTLASATSMYQEVAQASCCKTQGPLSF